MRAPRSWDVFCRVVDNYGDAAVCWRLARGLASGTQGRTRLWIDDPGPLRAMLPRVALDSTPRTLAGVEICHWTADADFRAPADVVVDAFGGGIPEVYAEAMVASGSSSSLWIVLEYLSAEPWVAAHHGLPSPHPRLRLERYFFFPGFGPASGGLLREAELDARREEFLAQPQKQEAFWREAGFPPPPGEARLISLFAYENAAVAELIETWSSGKQSIVAAVPEGRLSAAVASCLGMVAKTAPAGRAVRRSALEVRFLPFLAQDRYDELLWASHWNFVRGEDSFVRAQWAERPFVWHAYPQAEGAHLAKLEAFLATYCLGLAPDLAGPLATLWRGWNLASPLPSGAMSQAWSLLDSRGVSLGRHARAWAAETRKTGDLVRNLTKFCAERLK